MRQRTPFNYALVLAVRAEFVGSDLGRSVDEIVGRIGGDGEGYHFPSENSATCSQRGISGIRHHSANLVPISPIGVNAVRSGQIEFATQYGQIKTIDLENKNESY